MGNSRAGILSGALALACWMGVGAKAHAQSCSAFRSCAEAMDSLRSGNTRLDKDGDGIPCESLCKGASSGGSGSSNQYASPARQPRQANPAGMALRGPAQLISVGDGDTIRVITSNGQKVTIRLACIDAPERAQGESGSKPTHELKQLLAAGSLVIRPQTVHRYGRTVTEVLAGGRNVNLEMVRAGMAHTYRQHQGGCDKAAYLGAERQAEQQQLGVWKGGGSQQRPWDFRKNR